MTIVTKSPLRFLSQDMSNMSKAADILRRLKERQDDRTYQKNEFTSLKEDLKRKGERVHDIHDVMVSFFINISSVLLIRKMSFISLKEKRRKGPRHSRCHGKFHLRLDIGITYQKNEFISPEKERVLSRYGFNKNCGSNCHHIISVIISVG